MCAAVDTNPSRMKRNTTIYMHGNGGGQTSNVFLNFRFRYNWWEVVHWSLSLEGCVCCVGKVLAAALHAKSNGFFAPLLGGGIVEVFSS